MRGLRVVRGPLGRSVALSLTVPAGSLRPIAQMGTLRPRAHSLGRGLPGRVRPGLLLILPKLAPLATWTRVAAVRVQGTGRSGDRHHKLVSAASAS